MCQLYIVVDICYITHPRCFPFGGDIPRICSLTVESRPVCMGGDLNRQVSCLYSG